MSWVDELILHSSPFAGSREEHGRTLTDLATLRDPKKYIYPEATEEYWMIREALKSLRRIPRTLIHNFGKSPVKETRWQDHIDRYIATIVDAGGNPIKPRWILHEADININSRFIMPGVSRGEEQDEVNDKVNSGKIRRFTDIAQTSETKQHHREGRGPGRP